MKYATKTNNKTVLLAILAVFAMIAAGAVVAMAASDTDAVPAGDMPNETDTADADYKPVIDAHAAAQAIAAADKIVYLDMSAETADVTLTLTGAYDTTVYVKPATASGVKLVLAGVATQAYTIAIAQSIATDTVTYYCDSVLTVTKADPASNDTISFAYSAATGPVITCVGSAENVSGMAGTTYGITYFDASVNTFYVYAQGSTAPAITLDNAGDIVAVKNGSATVTSWSTGNDGYSVVGFKDVVTDMPYSLTCAATGVKSSISGGHASAEGAITVSNGAVTTTDLVGGLTGGLVWNMFSTAAMSNVAVSDAVLSAQASNTSVFVYGDVSGTITATGDITFVKVKGTVTNINTAVERKVGGTSTSPYTGVLNAGTVTVEEGTLVLQKGTFTTVTPSAGTIVTVNEGVTVQIDAGWACANAFTLNLYGSLQAATAQAANFEGNPTVVNLGPNATVSNVTFTANANLTINILAENAEDLSGTQYKDREVINAKVATANYIISEDTTLVVSGILNLDGKTVDVYGTLDLRSTGSIEGKKVGAVYSGAIVLHDGGEIINAGTIGKTNAVVVKYNDGTADKGIATVQSVKGVNFDVGTDYNFGAYLEPHLSVSGSIVASPGAFGTQPELGINACIIDDALTVSAGVKLTAATAMSYVQSEALLLVANGGLLVSGTYAASVATPFITIEYGAEFETLGNMTGSIAAQVFTHLVATSINAPEYATTTFSSANNEGTGAGAPDRSVSGFAISIDRISYKDGASVYYDQRAYISGDVKIKSTEAVPDNSIKTLVIGGNAFVAADDILTISNTENAVTQIGGLAAGDKLIVEGELVGLNATSNASTKTKIAVLGVAYTVSVGNVDTYYVDGYADGLAALALVDSIKIYGAGAGNYGYGVGKYTMTDSLEIGNGETVAADGAAITVPKSCVIMVKNGGSFNAACLVALSGKVVVESGATCTSMSNSLYEVSSKSADNTVTYAGLEVVLAEAAPGDVITLPGEMGRFITELVVPEGVTLNVTGTLKARQIVVEEDATVKMTSSGSIVMTSYQTTYSKIKVMGTMDLTVGNMSFTAAAENKSTVESTGVLSYTGEPFVGAKIVGTTYTTLTGATVLTSLENAVDAGALEIDIAGTYKDTGSIAIGTATLKIAATGVVEIGAVDISGGAIEVAAGGEFTGTIIGSTGVLETATPVSLSVTGFTGKIENKCEINASAEYEYTFVTAENLTGGIILSAGKLVMEHNIAPGAANTFSVGPAAELSVAETKAIGDAKAFIVTGTLTVAKNKTLTVNPDFAMYGTANVKGAIDINSDEFELSGNMTVAAASSVAGVFAFDDGTLSIGEDAAFTVESAMIFGSPAVGAGPSILGKITLGNNTFTIDYTGTLDADDFIGATGAVAYDINLIDYVTVFFKGVVDADDVLADIDFSGVSGLDITTRPITTIGNWKYLNGAAAVAGDDLEDGKDLFYIASVQVIDIIASWDDGMSLYIDNVRVTIPAVELEVGTHTVMVKANPGYKFADGTTPSITFAGKAVTGLLVIEVTPDMADTDPVLSATADIVVDEQPIPEQKEKDDTMMIILLAILVIMIAILIVVVILRMMRS